MNLGNITQTSNLLSEPLGVSSSPTTAKAVESPPQTTSEAAALEATQLGKDIGALTGAVQSGNLSSVRRALSTMTTDVTGPPPPTPSEFLNAASIGIAAAGMLQQSDATQGSASASNSNGVARLDLQG